MKLHRNFLICVLAVAAVLLCLLALPQSAQAASESDLTFTLNAAGDGYIVSDCDTAATGELVIPATYNGKPVTSIGEWAFSSCKSLSSITIPDSVTSIGNYAFYYCTSLTSVTIPGSVTSIGGWAFSNCTSLTSVTIPEGVTNIGDFAFDRCSGLTSVVIPNSVAWMGYSVFISCDLSSVIYCGTSEEWDAVVKGEYLSNHPAEFGPDAPMPDPITDEVLQFHNYKDSVCTICGDAAAISPLTFTLNAAGDGYIVSGCDTAATGELVIPGTYNGKPVTEIGDSAFRGCTKLTGITIPASVTSIGGKVFNACDNLSSLQVAEGNTIYHSAGNCIIKTGSKTLVAGCKTSRIPTDGSVKTIGEFAFYGCKSLTEIVLPESITAISGSAFCYCTKLTDISIADGVTSIGSYAFAYCTSLTGITIPDSVTSIGSYAFAYCTSLTDISITDGVTSIGSYAFAYCTSLTSITIPDSVTSLGYAAFAGCSKLESITVPFVGISREESSGTYNTLGRIFGKSSYTGGVATTHYSYTYYIPSSLKAVTVTGGKLDGYAFRNCTNLTSVTLGNGVTSIGYSAFYGCTGLTSITIPDSVTSIGSSAFSNCNNLSYNVYGNGKYLGNEANPYVILVGVTSQDHDNYTIHPQTKFIMHDAFRGCTSLTSVTIPDSVTSIGDFAFYGCTGLTSITIPNSVTSIGSSTFRGCTGLTSITIPDSVTSIGGYAFYGCTGLTSITIPSSVTSIGSYAFYGCTGLTSVTIGNGVTRIGDYAFYECSSLTSITIPDSVTSIGYYAFRGCTSLTSVTIGNGVTSIDVAAFYGCTGLTSVTIGNGVTKIGGYAFYECSSLTSITIPDSVTGIGEWAFYGCTGLTSVTIGNGVTSIGSSAFRHCDRLTSITIPASVTSIGERAFNACENLSSLQVAEGNTIYHSAGNCIIKTGSKTLVAGCKTSRIPTDGSVKTIGAFAFYGCKSLTEIVLPESITAISGSAFCHCTQLTDISITDGVTSIGESAFNYCTKLATVIYCGTQEQWNAMTVSDGNTYLKNATLQFHNYENGVCTVCGPKNEEVAPQTVTTSVTVSGDTVYRGDTVTVTVSATAVERCNSGGFVFDFDTSAFEYVSGKALVSGFTNAGVSTENGRIAGYFMGNEATVQGDLFQITLRVKDGASFTEHTISGISSFGVKTNGVTENISGANNDAEVTVVCNHSFGDWIAVDEIWRKHICTICSYEETAYAEYTVTFQYADGTVISSTQYRYGDAVVVPDAPPAQERNYIFTGWDKEITAVCNGDCVYTAVFVTYILGDMDGDGITTHEDAIYLLLNVMFGDEFYPLSYAPADMNDNGIVDVNDAVYLLLHILFGEAFYPLDKG